MLALMAPDPNSRAAQLRLFLQSRKVSAKEAAKRANIPYTTLMNFLSGATRSMRGEAEDKLAAAFGLSRDSLFGGTLNPALSTPQSFGEMPAAPVIGTVEAGAWREAVAIEHSEDYIKFIPHPAFPADQQLAMRVSGPSCNRVVQDGGFAIVVPYEAVPGGIDALVMRDEPPLVIFERERGGAYEYTMKSLVRATKGFELRPVSDHPAHQQVVQLNENGDTSHVRIAFVVVQTLNNVF